MNSSQITVMSMILENIINSQLYTLEKCLTLAVERHFNGEATTVIALGNDDINALIRRIHLLRHVHVVSLNEGKASEIRTGNVLMFGKMEDFSKLRQISWKRRTKLLVACVGEKINTSEKVTAMNYLRLLWDITKVVDISITIAGESPVYNFYTWFPFRVKYCRSVHEVHLLDNFLKDSFVNDANLFPPKIPLNFNRCNLYITYIHQIPWVNLKSDEEQKSGTQLSMIKILASKYNMTIVYVAHPKNEEFLVASPDKGAIGLLGKGVDLALAITVVSYQRYTLSDMLQPYGQSSFIWIYYPLQLVPNWTKVFRSFSPSLWAAIVFVLLLLTFSYNFISNFCKESQYISLMVSFLNVLALNLNSSIPKLPQRTLFRCFFTMISGYALHISTAYNSKLISLLTAAGESKPITSLPELHRLNYNFYMTPAYASFLNYSGSQINYILRHGRVTFDFSVIRRLKETVRTKGASICNKDADKMYGREVTDIGKLKTVKGLVHHTYSTFYTSKHNLLYDFFNLRIQWLVEGGFPNFLYDNIIEEFSPKTPGKDKKIRLSLRHIEGAFILWGIGIIIATSYFLCEIILQVFKRRRSNAEIRQLFSSKEHLPSGKDMADHISYK